MLTWDISRGKDFQCVSQLVQCIHSLPNFSHASGQALDKWLRREDNPDPQFKHLVTTVLGDFLYIASTDGLNDPFTQVSQRVAPIEFVLIGMSTSDYPE